jgi:hypothetical protein
MKKNYLAPSMTVMEIHAASLLSGSGEQSVRGIGGGTVGFGGAGDGSSTGGGSPRSRGFDGWDDEEDEDY